jgi:hypothetical protein
MSNTEDTASRASSEIEWIPKFNVGDCIDWGKYKNIYVKEIDLEKKIYSFEERFSIGSMYGPSIDNGVDSDVLTFDDKGNRIVDKLIERAKLHVAGGKSIRRKSNRRKSNRRKSNRRR